jgi:alpha-mannosidase
MKRCELLKGLSIVARSALCTSPASSMVAMGRNQEAGAPLAMPIRALVKKDGRLLQPVQVTLQPSGADATVVTKLNGMEVDRRVLPAGSHTFNVFAAPVSSPQDATVQIEIGGKVTSTVVNLQPVPQIYGLHITSLAPRPLGIPIFNPMSKKSRCGT